MFFSLGQVISQNLHNRPDVISTNEGPATDDDSYLGYSVAAGDFSGGGGSQNDVAVGMPRGAGLLGKVSHAKIIYCTIFILHCLCFRVNNLFFQTKQIISKSK